MTTLFLKWNCMGTIWSAKDLIDDDVRWIIERTNGGIKKFELFHVICNLKTKVGSSDVFFQLAWKAVAENINNAAHICYSGRILNLNKERIEKAKILIDKMSDGEMKDMKNLIKENEYAI